MAGETERRERACNEAPEEMVERAELQFKAANDLYVKLKRAQEREGEARESQERKGRGCRTEGRQRYTRIRSRQPG